jgi:hypothetical protein
MTPLCDQEKNPVASRLIPFRLLRNFRADLDANVRSGFRGFAFKRTDHSTVR